MYGELGEKSFAKCISLEEVNLEKVSNSCQGHKVNDFLEL